ncbi:MAG: tail fiber domain-containing protein, partial [Candidatus Omnitrophota bacterium]
SDIRLKKNVKNIQNALDKMLKLRGVTYQWKNPQEHGNMTGTYMSMVAQEVEEIFPEWIGTDSKGYKTLGFIGFEALTAESIKELKRQIDVLTARIEALEAKTQ